MPSIWLCGGFGWLCPGWPRGAFPTSRFRWLRLLPSAICLPLPGCSIENSGIPGEISCGRGQTKWTADPSARRFGPTRERVIETPCAVGLPAPTVSFRWLPGAAAACLPCGSSNTLRFRYLLANSCTLGLTMKVCDLFALQLTVFPAVVSRARLHPFARRGSPSTVLGQTARGLSPSQRSWRRRGW